jgi:hypothetical protein
MITSDTSKKNELIIELNLLRIQGQRQKMFEVASKVASLEVKIAIANISNPDHAAINLISAASCLQLANKNPEAKRLLTLAHALVSGDSRAWILDALTTIEMEIGTNPNLST